MTYLELYEYALLKLHNSLITLGEFETMIEPLNRKIEVEPKTERWTRSHTGTIGEGSYCSRCGKMGYKTDFCPNCGAMMKGEEQ